MTTFDLSPLYRTAIGFDRLADMLSNASRVDGNGYPPYNIEARGEDQYRISMAVAGFSESELDIVTEQNTLTVSGQKAGDDERDDREDREFLYRGIATRSFERRFQLADHVRVVSAKLENGLLHIELQRELPEKMKPRRIEIGGDRSTIDSTIDSSSESNRSTQIESDESKAA
ncbi:MAG TPA: Hsp20 family protein [Wenzhouxiangellaceae bacterium]|nr:Hsp20 family protein [Wenzhouxiangellaceae bacterium]